MVAGAILNRVFTSADSGQTWTEAPLKSSLGVFGDPAIVASPKGDFYYFHLSDPSGKGWSDPDLLDQIVCQRSTDNGMTWNDGSGIGKNGSKDQDKEWAAIDPSGKRLYVTWTQFDKYDSKSPGDSTVILFSRARRKALRWSEPVRLSDRAGDCLDSDETVEGAVPAVGPKGEVYVVWALGEDLWFERSFSRGKRWAERDRPIARIIGGWDQEIPGINRANGMPVTVTDVSNGAHRGNVYVMWSDVRNGSNNTDVFCIRSTDRGESWSEPVRVNDDNTERHQFFPWLTSDPSTGYLYAVFYDRRNHDGEKTDVYLATSTDGGQTWFNECISERPFLPNAFAFFGDYTNISAVNGVVRPIWTRLDKGKLSVWTAIINK